MHRKRLTMYTTLTIVFVGMTGTEHVNWGQPFHPRRTCHGIVV